MVFISVTSKCERATKSPCDRRCAQAHCRREDSALVAYPQLSSRETAQKTRKLFCDPLCNSWGLAQQHHAPWERTDLGAKRISYVVHDVINLIQPETGENLAFFQCLIEEDNAARPVAVDLG